MLVLASQSETEREPSLACIYAIIKIIRWQCRNKRNDSRNGVTGEQVEIMSRSQEARYEDASTRHRHTQRYRDPPARCDIVLDGCELLFSQRRWRRRHRPLEPYRPSLVVILDYCMVFRYKGYFSVQHTYLSRPCKLINEKKNKIYIPTI